MTNATKQYRDRLHTDAQASEARHDPEKMMESLKLQGVKFVKIQAWTLLFEDPAQLERILRATPELGEKFICLTREDI